MFVLFSIAFYMFYVICQINYSTACNFLYVLRVLRQGCNLWYDVIIERGLLMKCVDETLLPPIMPMVTNSKMALTN